MSLNISGLPAGTATVEVTQGGNTDSASTTALPAPQTAPTGSTRYLGKAKDQIWGGVTASVVDGGNGSTWGVPTHPRLFIRSLVSQGASGEQVYFGLKDSEYRAEAFIGGRADVYRVANGVFSYLRSSQVVGGDSSVKHRIGAGDSTGYTQAGGFSFRFDSFNRPDHTYYFGVAAVDAGGQIGAVAWTGGYYPGDVSNGQGTAQDNTNTVDLGQPYTEGGPLAAPGNPSVTADPSGPAAVNLTWDAVAGAVAYMPFLSYSDPATHPVQTYLELDNDGGPQVQSGDMVTITQRVDVPDASFISPRVWKVGSIWSQFETPRTDGVFLNTSSKYTYRFNNFDSGDPYPDPKVGSTYLRCNVAGNVSSALLLHRFWHSTPTQSFYTVLDPAKTYRFSVWARADRPISFLFTFNFDGQVFEPSANLSTEWQQFTFEGSPTQINTTQPREWILRVSTSGEGPVQIDFAGVQMYETGTGFNNFLPERKNLISPGMILRDHSLIKDTVNATDVEALTNPPGGSARATTLETFLYNCLDTGAEPWIQIEWYHRPQDWADLMAYLGAPVSSGHPMALKRAAQGMEEPWTDVFSRILFEIGNEAWNFISEFRNPPALVDSVDSTFYGTSDVYGFVANLAANAMESSPYWSPKIEWILGGWITRGFGIDAARRFKRPCKVGIANYNGGWDVGTNLVSENDESYQAVMGVVPASTGPGMDDQIERLQALADEPGSPYVYGENLRVSCYEAGPGYQLNGLVGATLTPVDVVFQEVVMKSRATATGTLDTFGAQAEKGFSEGNFFVLGPGNYWRAYANETQGGGVFPSYQVLKILQDNIAPARSIEIQSPSTETLTVIDNLGNPVEAEAIFAYGFESVHDPSRIMLAIGNRSRTATIKPTILTGLTSADSCTVWANVGDYREHNRYQPGRRLASTIRVEGGSQSGTSMNLSGFTFNPQVGDTFTIDGQATTYTVSDIGGFAKPEGTITFSPSLAASPADQTVVEWSSVIDGYGPDPLCVPIDIAATSVPVPADLTRFSIDDLVGATAAGLPPGCCVILMLEGAR